MSPSDCEAVLCVIFTPIFTKFASSPSFRNGWLWPTIEEYLKSLRIQTPFGIFQIVAPLSPDHNQPFFGIGLRCVMRLRWLQCRAVFHSCRRLRFALPRCRLSGDISILKCCAEADRLHNITIAQLLRSDELCRVLGAEPRAGAKSPNSTHSIWPGFAASLQHGDLDSTPSPNNRECTKGRVS